MEAELTRPEEKSLQDKADSLDEVVSQNETVPPAKVVPEPVVRTTLRDPKQPYSVTMAESIRYQKMVLRMSDTQIANANGYLPSSYEVELL